MDYPDEPTSRRNENREALPSAPHKTLWHDAQPLSGNADDYDGLLDLVGAASIVMIGEASHGTHEFYRERARITRRLIEEKGFAAVAVEADWPDAYRVNRYVRGAAEDADADEALGGFRRFPTWMWRNAEVLDFVGWLRDHNDRGRTERRGRLLRPRPLQPPRVDRRGDRLPRPGRPARGRAGRASATPASSNSAAEPGLRAAVSFGISESVSSRGDRPARSSCGEAPTATCAATGSPPRTSSSTPSRTPGWSPDAEEYYRSMFAAAASSWNLRDRHMADTLARLRSPPRRATAGPGKDRRLGAQLPRRRRPADRDGRNAANSTSASLPASATARGGRADRLHHLHGHGHRCLGLGRAGRAQEGAPGTPREL